VGRGDHGGPVDTEDTGGSKMRSAREEAAKETCWWIDEFPEETAYQVLPGGEQSLLRMFEGKRTIRKSQRVGCDTWRKDTCTCA